jgi:photosynthetic reaction center H subunit
MAQRVGTETQPAALAIQPLSRMPDCELAEGAPDVRGWEVTTPTSAHVGVVKDLLIDLGTMCVRYLDVVLDGEPGSSRRVLLPIGTVWINDALDQVVTTVLDVDAFPDYDPASFNREFERDLLSRLGHSDEIDDFYASPAFDHSRFRRRGSDAAVCGRREDDAETGACSLHSGATQVPEAANGVELPVTDAAAD